ncbi:MAG: sugar porter family MFS transporter [Planctomycetaceae bacterium]|nr:sugar porter family MFS transporter [Planctomycetaceae bacterium]
MSQDHSTHGPGTTSGTGTRYAYLLLITAVAALGGFLFGFDTGVVSGLNKSVKEYFSLDDAALEGFFVSCVTIGCILGAALAGYASDLFGRKKVLLLSGILLVVSALGCGFPPGFAGLIFCRFVGGVGVGVASMVAPLYISEISPPSIRGRLVTLFQLAIVFGIFSAYASNAVIRYLPDLFPISSEIPGISWIFVNENWRGMFLMGCLPAVLYFVAAFFVPESPRWWAGKNRDDKAMLTLEKLFGREEARREMQDIRAVLAEETGRFTEIFSRKYRFGLMIGVLLMFFSQVTGINVIMYFGNQVFEEAGYSDRFSYLLQTFVGLANIAFTLFAVWKIDQWGRKPLLKIGTISICATLALIGVLFALKSQGIGENVLLYFLPILIVMFIASFAMSWGPIPWVVVSEIFPTRIRGRAASLGTMTIWISCFLVVQTFPWLRGKGPELCFAIYAGLMIPALIFVWRYLPETKGRSLEELEKYLYSSTGQEDG